MFCRMKHQSTDQQEPCKQELQQYLYGICYLNLIYIARKFYYDNLDCSLVTLRTGIALTLNFRLLICKKM